jgi:hypothetical protein
MLNSGEDRDHEVGVIAGNDDKDRPTVGIRYWALIIWTPTEPGGAVSGSASPNDLTERNRSLEGAPVNEESPQGSVSSNTPNRLTPDQKELWDEMRPT